MNLLSLLIPNLNTTTLFGIGIIVIGVLALLLASVIPIPQLRITIIKIAWFGIIIGILWFWGISLIQNIISDSRILAVIVVLLILGVAGFLLFKKR